MIIGLVAGTICYWFCTVVKHRLKYDDTLDVFGVHGVGGIMGTLFAGVFATAFLSVGPDTPNGISGLLEGNPKQLWLQAIGVVTTIVWCAIGTWVCLMVTKALCGLRASTEEEREGLDLALHGESLHQ
jgi:Amt family ammonium transporter